MNVDPLHQILTPEEWNRAPNREQAAGPPVVIDRPVLHRMLTHMFVLQLQFNSTLDWPPLSVV